MKKFVRIIPAAVVALLLATSVPVKSQTGGTDSAVQPQVIAPQSAPASGTSDANDSGYTSTYLQQHDWTASDDTDDARLRKEANMQRRGGNPNLAGDVMSQAQQVRALYPQLFGAAPLLPGTPVWFSIGPTKSNHIQNGVLRTVVDSGRMRTILPHPSNPNILYLLTSSGGLWKTTNLSKNKPDWVAKTDFVATTSGGAAAFGP